MYVTINASIAVKALEKVSVVKAIGPNVWLATTDPFSNPEKVNVGKVAGPAVNH
ncbi:hypothetical protein [Ruegeria sp. HKCCA4008]|uniref:hypothetical protein n=1 Tax=Ruegeria sp. HKCCA4008 TaxID=2682999 RepID=UPI00148865CA|nr:hypothetical protein [Ruegeria sp. HKCCA4008]